MSWQAVGSPQSFTYVAKDIEGDENHSFTFNGNEGNVTVHFLHGTKRDNSCFVSILGFQRYLPSSGI